MWPQLLTHVQVSEKEANDLVKSGSDSDSNSLTRLGVGEWMYLRCCQ